MDLAKVKSGISALTLIVITTFTALANATLIGDTITSAGISLSPGSETIGSGVEFAGIHTFLNFDFGADTLTITPNIGVGWRSFGSYLFSGFDEPITSFTVASNTGFTGGIVNNFSFTSNSITLDMNSGSASYGSELVFDIASAQGAKVHAAPVPEPGTMMFLGIGMVGLVIYGKRRKNNRV